MSSLAPSLARGGNISICVHRGPRRVNRLRIHPQTHRRTHTGPRRCGFAPHPDAPSGCPLWVREPRDPFLAPSLVAVQNQTVWLRPAPREQPYTLAAPRTQRGGSSPAFGSKTQTGWFLLWVRRHTFPLLTICFIHLPASRFRRPPRQTTRRGKQHACRPRPALPPSACWH